MKLIFIRHGDPCKDSFGLTEKGQIQSSLLGGFFNGKIIKGIFVSPSKRAQETLKFFLNYYSLNNKITFIKDIQWLNEFKYEITLPDGSKQFPWEIPLDYWCSSTDMLDLSTCMDNDIYISGDIKERMQLIWGELDRFLSNVGYTRRGNYYHSNCSNRDCYVFISHFATISIILGHLLNIPPNTMLHHFWQGPSGVTTLQSEEVDFGKVLFRCIGYNETVHLPSLNANFKSLYGLKQEVFNQKENN